MMYFKSHPGLGVGFLYTSDEGEMSDYYFSGSASA